MDTQELVFKFLNGGKSTIQNFEWYLPHGKRPGKWMPEIKGTLIACENGYPPTFSEIAKGLGKGRGIRS